MTARAAEVTGQFVLWNRGASPITGVNSVLVFGILGLPTELAKEFCANERLKRCVLGSYVPELGMRLLVSDDATEEYPAAYKTLRVDQLICRPMWRV